MGRYQGVGGGLDSRQRCFRCCSILPEGTDGGIASMSSVSASHRFSTHEMSPEIVHSWFRQRKVLVLGGSGFIGQHLVRTLVQLQADVTVVVHRTPLPMAAGDAPGLRILPGDVCDDSFLSGLVQGAEV